MIIYETFEAQLPNVTTLPHAALVVFSQTSKGAHHAAWFPASDSANVHKAAPLQSGGASLREVAASGTLVSMGWRPDRVLRSPEVSGFARKQLGHVAQGRGAPMGVVPALDVAEARHARLGVAPEATSR